jgi:hypothetical protein
MKKQLISLSILFAVFNITDAFAEDVLVPYPATSGFEKDYFNSSETLEYLKKLEKAYPRYVKLFDLNKLTGYGKTVEGNSIWAIQVSSNPSVIEDEEKILIIGNHHARELMTHHAVMDSAFDLLRNLNSTRKKTRKKANKILDDTAIWFIPTVNPDGLNYVFTHNRWWRKNRKDNKDGTFGVDLNRNYGFKWGVCGSNSDDGSSNIFRGPLAFSEIETSVVDGLNRILRAQYVISYHSSGNEVLYPYVCGDLGQSEGSYYKVRDELAAELDYDIRVASSSGEDFEHHYNRYGSISFLLEIGEEFQPFFSVYEDEVLPTVKKVIPFMLKKLKENFITLKVVDSHNVGIKGAKVIVDEINFRQGEQRVTDQFGSFRIQLSSKKYKLIITSLTGVKKSIDVDLTSNRSIQKVFKVVF